MPDNVQVENPPSMTNLVTGIIGDAERLVRQEVTLARRELQVELGKLETAAVSMATGMGVCLLAVLFLGFMVVYLLNYLAQLPEWGGFLIVGVVLGIVGGALLFLGAQRARNVNLVPPQTSETMRENVQWLQNQR